MQNFPKQAKRALRAYMERGEEAIQKAAAGDLASFEDVLRWRKAAFHNFRVADALAQRDGEDIASDPDVQEMWTTIQGVDERLRDTLLELHTQTGSQIQRMSAAPQKLGRYHSGRADPAKFTHSA